MESQQLGEHRGLWASAAEIVAQMLHIDAAGAWTIAEADIYEGMVVRDRELPQLVFEVFLWDKPGGRFFLKEW